MKKFLKSNFYLFLALSFFMVFKVFATNYTIASKEPNVIHTSKSCSGGCGSIEGLIPFVDWTNNLIQFEKYEIFGLFTFRDFTRALQIMLMDFKFY